jgi:transposase, IS30 family
MSQLDYTKRIRIQSLLYDSHFFQRQIAKSIGVSEATISNELKRFKQQGILYDAKVAQQRKEEKRIMANQGIHTRIIKGTDLEVYITTHLEKRRSPEQIAATRSLANPEDTLCFNTLYTYIYTQHPERKKLYLRRKGKKYRHTTGSKTKILNRIWIEHRPKAVDEKIEIGHLEGDTVVWKNKSDCTITLIERTTNIFLSRVVHLKPWEKLSIVVSTLISEMLLTLPKEMRKTLTLDNGTEFADHEYITGRCGTQVYFANPYHSWERGANENMNGLLRQFIPKKTSFKYITQEMLDYYVHLINTRPRKKHGRQSPAEVYANLFKI